MKTIFVGKLIKLFKDFQKESEPQSTSDEILDFFSDSKKVFISLIDF